MFKDAKFQKQRQPKRHTLAAVAGFFLFAGIILSITIILAVVGIPFILAGLIVLLVRSRIKTVEVTCPNCQVTNKVEETVKYFNCEQCSHTVHTSIQTNTAGAQL